MEEARSIICCNDVLTIWEPPPTSRPAISTGNNALHGLTTGATDRELDKVAIPLVTRSLPDHLFPARMPVVRDHINTTRGDRLRQLL